jgi:hypothetical protein
MPSVTWRADQIREHWIQLPPTCIRHHQLVVKEETMDITVSQTDKRVNENETSKPSTSQILAEVQKLRDLADSETKTSDLRFKIRRSARHIEEIVRSA